MKEQDWNRARFVEKTYGRKIDDPLLYDGIWNTERIPVDLLAKAAVDWVEATKSR